MLKFTEKQIKDLKGSYSIIARSCNVSNRYVKMILTGEREQNSEKAKEVATKAKAVFDAIQS